MVFANCLLSKNIIAFDTLQTAKRTIRKEMDVVQFCRIRTRATLDFMLIICVFVDALYIPFSVALIDSDTQLWTYQLIAESVIDCIFVIDWLSYLFTA